ncbi:MAG: N-acetylneuraminate synthase [Phycisphaeraceae bacterium]
MIAEIGVNHDGDIDRALQLVRVAAESGADAVKFQCFHPARLLSNQARLASYQTGQAGDAAELLAPLMLSREQLKQVRDEARKLGLAFVATPFSPEDVDTLSALDVDAVKIASPDAVNIPLIRRAMSLNKPMFISTGTCTLDELQLTADWLGQHEPGGVLMQCVSSYPTPTDRASINGMVVLGERFGLPVGYSDHTQNTETGALAVAAGAILIEKHLTHDRSAPGPDHAASADPTQLVEYIRLIRKAQAMLGPKTKRIWDVEADVREVSRQSVCAVRDLPAGHRLTAEDLTVKRPGTGIPANMIEDLIGQRLGRSLRAGDLLMPGDVQP